MARRHAFIALFVVLAAHVALTAFELPGSDIAYGVIELGALALISARAVAIKRNRGAWGLFAAGIALWVIGDAAFTVGADAVCAVAYLSMFGALYLALAGLLRDRVRPFPAWLTIDGLLAGLALTALASAAFYPLRDATHGDINTVAVALARLVGDLLLLVVVLVGFTATGGRPGRSWWPLGAGLAVTALGDAIYALLDDYTPGTPLDSLWLLAVILFAVAAWQRTAAPTRAHVGWAMAAVPLTGSALSITTLLAAGLLHGRPITLFLAAAALFAALARAILMLGENFRLLSTARHEALTDKLTDLPNRRALVHDLDRASATGRSHTLVFFDLDGFKDYNDAFGHPAGDALLRRLAPALARVGHAYRLGGDEFCLLVEAAMTDDDPMVLGAVDALSEHGDGFSITASHGLVVLPRDVADATDALRLADERMYARKRRKRTGSRGQARDLLVKVMAERNGSHEAVAELAAAVGRALGLDAEELDVLIRAAELHDVGTLAVPDEILHKDGPLDPEEWAVMRQHTVAGERILGAAESMRPVARLVRAAHERWDGRGYPDQLRGEEIPLGARIIYACDAYDAMVRGASYREALEPAAAIEELRRCAGTQFDPRVVETLTQLCQGFATLASSGRADDQRGC